jgi:hypothetical protein
MKVLPMENGFIVVVKQNLVVLLILGEYDKSGG